MRRIARQLFHVVLAYSVLVGVLHIGAYLWPQIEVFRNHILEGIAAAVAALHIVVFLYERRRAIGHIAAFTAAVGMLVVLVGSGIGLMVLMGKTIGNQHSWAREEIVRANPEFSQEQVGRAMTLVMNGHKIFR